MVERGVKYDGKPCRKCSGTLRYVSNKKCVGCIQEQSRRRRAENPEVREKNREQRRRWYEKNREKALEQSCRWRAENPEKVQEQRRRWREENSEKHREHNREYMRRWRAKNPEKSRERLRRWRAENSGKNPAKELWVGAKSRAKRKGQEFTITIADVEAAIKEANGWCEDEGIPLIKGEGKVIDNSPTLDRIDNSKGYIPGNIRVISHKANRIKRNAIPPELKKMSPAMERRVAEMVARL